MVRTTRIYVVPPRNHVPHVEEECVVFLGTRFSNLFTAVDTKLCDRDPASPQLHYILMHVRQRNKQCTYHIETYTYRVFRHLETGRWKLQPGFGQFLTMCFGKRLAGYAETCGIGLFFRNYSSLFLEETRCLGCWLIFVCLATRWLG